MVRTGNWDVVVPVPVHLLCRVLTAVIVGISIDFVVVLFEVLFGFREACLHPRTGDLSETFTEQDSVENQVNIEHGPSHLKSGSMLEVFLQLWKKSGKISRRKFIELCKMVLARMMKRFYNKTTDKEIFYGFEKQQLK